MHRIRDVKNQYPSSKPHSIKAQELIHPYRTAGPSKRTNASRLNFHCSMRMGAVGVWWVVVMGRSILNLLVGVVAAGEAEGVRDGLSGVADSLLSLTEDGLALGLGVLGATGDGL
jgi:hypothetical protein